MSFYAVARGHSVGIVTDWSTCSAMVFKFKNAKFKKFSTHAEAEAFIKEHAISKTTNMTITTNPTSKKRAAEISSSALQSQWVNHDGKKTKHTDEHLNTASSSTSSIITSLCHTEEENREDQCNELIVYTDGGCRPDAITKKPVAAIGVFFGDQDDRNYSERLAGERQTNQRAELMAGIRAMEIAPSDQPLCIRSDSRYLVSGMNEWILTWSIHRWQQLENRDLFRRLQILRSERKASTRFEWVKAHSGIYGNEMADQLSTMAIKSLL